MLTVRECERQWQPVDVLTSRSYPAEALRRLCAPCAPEILWLHVMMLGLRGSEDHGVFGVSEASPSWLTVIAGPVIEETTGQAVTTDATSSPRLTCPRSPQFGIG